MTARPIFFFCCHLPTATIGDACCQVFPPFHHFSTAKWSSSTTCEQISNNPIMSGTFSLHDPQSKSLALGSLKQSPDLQCREKYLATMLNLTERQRMTRIMSWTLGSHQVTAHLGTLGLDWLYLGLENKSLWSVGINFKSNFLRGDTLGCNNLPDVFVSSIIMDAYQRRSTVVAPYVLGCLSRIVYIT